ncbi:fungal-specific transcription factor domain-containing protein [Limtongia smithiae]|uniref:fungal-specific transcription factor domain-containing protein n=1 Tax=Limtongia smithiae TaxID=1125753 RepID=UPI0034CD3716
MSAVAGRKAIQDDIEQACDSCRRRKLKCTKDFPVCGHCRRHKRDCVYSPRAIRSPLTRKYLTQVENRVERLEQLLTELLPNADIDKLLASNSTASPRVIAAMAASIARQGKTVSESSSSPELALGGSGTTAGGSIAGSHSAFRMSASARSDTDEFLAISPAELEIDEHENSPEEILSGSDHPPMPIQESVPDEADGFDWVEQDVFNNDLSDGMAALSISPRGSGYFGAASSSVLLRVLRMNPGAGGNMNPDGSIYGVPLMPLYSSPAPRHVSDALIDAYFSIYHTSYPFLHEETFRAQYRGQISRPPDTVWEILFNTVLALGAWCLVNESSCADMAFYQNIKTLLTAEVIETGSLPLLQALILLSNYVQKRNRPNSGWNLLGIAHRMATGLGLHREFPGWTSSPLKQEMRRRVWWGLFMFDAGAAITFGRPVSWPDHGGVDVNEISNIHDAELTFDTRTMPPSRDTDITIYSGMIVQCRFHRMTNNLYNRLISKPSLTAEQTLSLAAVIDTFVDDLPYQFREDTPIDSTYDWFVFSRYRLFWRYRNLRLLAYRPFVLQRALSMSGAMEKAIFMKVKEEPSSPLATTVAPMTVTSKPPTSVPATPAAAMSESYKARLKAVLDETPAELACREKCMQDAHETILSVEDYIANRPISTLAVWYALYFLFQAGLIPLICFCSEPNSPRAPEWVQDIERTRAALAVVSSRNGLADKFLNLINGLIGSLVVNDDGGVGSAQLPTAGMSMGDFEKRTDWLNDVYSLLFEDPTSSSFMTGILRDRNDVVVPDGVVVGADTDAFGNDAVSADGPVLSVLTGVAGAGIGAVRIDRDDEVEEEDDPFSHIL